MCERTAAILATVGLAGALEEISLRRLGLTVRDFPEVAVVYLLRPTDNNYFALVRSLEIHR